MKSTRARFTCVGVNYFANRFKDVTFQPVGWGNPVNSSPAKENAKFWSDTPNGSIKLCLSRNCEVKFDLGKDYFVDFTPVEE